MIEQQESFNPLDAFIFALQDKQLQSSLELIKDIYLSKGGDRLKRIKESQDLWAQIINHDQVAYLYFQVAKDHQTYESFSTWCLKSQLKPQKKSLLKWIILISLTVSYHRNSQGSLPSQLSKNEKDYRQNMRNRSSSQSSMSESYSLSSQQEQVEALGNSKQINRSQRTKQFLQDSGNQEMYELLIQGLMNDVHQQQLVLWREFIYRMNSSNQLNNLNLAKIYLQKKDYQNTKKVLENISQSSNVQPLADELRSFCQFKKGSLKNAIYLMKRALKSGKHPSPDHCYFQLSQMCVKGNRYVEAIYYIEHILEIHKNNVDLNMIKASCLWHAGILQEALGVLEKIRLSAVPLDVRRKARVYFLLGRIHSELGSKMDIVHQYFDESYKEYQILHIIQHERPLKESTEDQNEYQANQFSQINLISYYKGVDFFRRKMEYEASNFLQDYIYKKPTLPHPYIFYLRLNIRKNPSVVLECLNTIVDLLPNEKQEIEFPELIKQFKVMLKEIWESKIFEKKYARDYQNRTIELSIEQQQMLQTNSKAISKLAIIQTWINLHTQRIREHLVQSSIYFFEIKRYDISIQVLKNFTQIKRNEETAHILSGKCYLQMKNYLEARDQFILAQKCDPHSLRARLGLFKVYYHLGNYEQALGVTQKLNKDYAKIESKEPLCLKQQCEFRRILGMIYTMMSNFKKAANEIVKSLQHLAPDEDCYEFLIVLYLQEKLQNEAKSITVAIQKHNNKQVDESTTKNLLISYLLLGDMQKIRMYLDILAPKNQQEDHLKLAAANILYLSSKELTNQQMIQSSSILESFLKSLENLNKQKQTKQSQLKMNIFTITAVAYRTAQQFFQTQCYEKASCFYQMPNKLQQYLNVVRKLKKCYQNFGDIKNYKKYYSILVDQLQTMYESQADSLIIMQLVQLYKQTNSSDKYYQLLKQVLTKNTNSLGYLSDMIDFQCQKQNFEAVIEYLNRMVEVEPYAAFQKMMVLSKCINMQKYPKYDKNDLRSMRFVFLSAEKQKKPLILTLFYLYLKQNDDAVLSFSHILKGLQTQSKLKVKAQINSMLSTFRKIDHKMPNTASIKILKAILQQYSSRQATANRAFADSLTSFQNIVAYIKQNQTEDLHKFSKSLMLLDALFTKINQVQALSFTNVDFNKTNQEILANWVHQSAKVVQKNSIFEKKGILYKKWIEFANALKYISFFFNKKQHDQSNSLFRKLQEEQIGIEALKEEYTRMFSQVNQLGININELGTNDLQQ